MTTPSQETRKEAKQKKESGGSQRKAAVVVAVVCVGVVAAIVAMNFDRLAALASRPDPTEEPVVTTPQANTVPVILGMAASTDRIEPLDVCQVTCEAEDTDGDVLTYTWTASQGDIVGEGATAEWCAPEVEGLFRVSAIVDDGRGGTAEYSTSLRVKANYAPEIVALTAASEWTMPETSVFVSCEASDLDGDELTYQWSATAGEVFGQGTSVVWLAPIDPGGYSVKVIVRDSYGGESMREVPMSVTPGTAPTLGRFRVKGIMTDMLKLYNDVWEVFMGRSISIQCNVTEGEGPFTYAWSADRGVLTAEGEIARWDAPESGGPATVVVNVTDVHGHTTVGTVLLSVETCTCKF